MSANSHIKLVFCLERFQMCMVPQKTVKEFHFWRTVFWKSTNFMSFFLHQSVLAIIAQTKLGVHTIMYPTSPALKFCLLMEQRWLLTKTAALCERKKCLGTENSGERIRMSKYLIGRRYKVILSYVVIVFLVGDYRFWSIAIKFSQKLSIVSFRNLVFRNMYGVTLWHLPHSSNANTF